LYQSENLIQYKFTILCWWYYITHHIRDRYCYLLCKYFITSIQRDEKNGNIINKNSRTISQ